MRTSDPGSRLTPTPFTACHALPPERAGLALSGPALAALTPARFAAIPGPREPVEGPPDGARRATRLLSAGFTLLELLVVISIIAIGSAGVSFALRDSTQTALEREGERLAALLEAGRALSRTSGQALLWRTTARGFTFDGLNAANLPQAWLGAGVGVRWSPSNLRQVLVLGPDPIIEPQTVTLVQDGRTLRVGSDGLHPFTVLAQP